MYKSGGSTSGIHIKKKNRGKFTEAAKRRGMGVQEFARHVLANKDKYSPLLVKRANFARNAAKWKKQEGGDVQKEYFNTLADYVSKYGWGNLTTEQKNWYRRNYPKYGKLAKQMSEKEVEDLLTRQTPMDVIDKRVPLEKRIISEKDSLRAYVNSPGFLKELKGIVRPYNTSEYNPLMSDFELEMRDSVDAGLYNEEYIRNRFGKEAGDLFKRDQKELRESPIVIPASIYQYDPRNRATFKAEGDKNLSYEDLKKAQYNDAVHNYTKNEVDKIKRRLDKKVDFDVTDSHPVFVEEPNTLAFYDPRVDSVYFRPRTFRPSTIAEETAHWSNVDEVGTIENVINRKNRNIDYINKLLDTKNLNLAGQTISHLKYLADDRERKAKQYATRRYLSDRGLPVTTDYSDPNSSVYMRAENILSSNYDSLPSNVKDYRNIYLNPRNDLSRYQIGGTTTLLSSFVPNELPKLQMKEGGGIPERYKNMGFTKVGQKKKSNRDGKKWMVLAKKGDKYKVVHGGYKGMKDFSQHGDKNRKKRFWDRMGGKNSAKAKDSFSPLYWHKRFGTWQEGGVVNRKSLDLGNNAYQAGGYSGKGSKAAISYTPEAANYNPLSKVKKAYDTLVNPTDFDFEASDKRIKDLEKQNRYLQQQSFNMDMDYLEQYPNTEFADEIRQKRPVFNYQTNPVDSNRDYLPNIQLQKGGLAKSQKSLKNWTNQEWMTSGTYSNKKKGSNKEVKSKGEKRYLPKNAWANMSSGEKAATNAAKKEGNKSGKQFVKQPKNIAKKAARFRMEGGFIREVKEGGKIPKEVLRPRLEKHMSPSDVNSYLSKYRTGGIIEDYVKVDGGYMVKFK